MNDLDDLDIKEQIKKISHKIDSIIEKVKDLEPERPEKSNPVESNDDENSQTL